MKRNGRPKESALGYSQKIVASDQNELERKLRLETATTAKETDEQRKTSLEKMVATELLKLAMEMEEGRKERLKKMVANHSAEASP